jgi:hypothetical protein
MISVSVTPLARATSSRIFALLLWVRGAAAFLGPFAFLLTFASAVVSFFDAALVLPPFCFLAFFM